MGAMLQNDGPVPRVVRHSSVVWQWVMGLPGEVVAPPIHKITASPTVDFT
jgi:hypothetical protein